MPGTKIKLDSHGLYVRTDGKLYRPVKTIDTYPTNPSANSREDGTSGFKEGSQVKARHLSGTPFCVVKTDTVEELWHSHGEYFGTTSVDCWHPCLPRT
jgi:hypothetical protein